MDQNVEFKIKACVLTHRKLEEIQVSHHLHGNVNIEDYRQSEVYIGKNISLSDFWIANKFPSLIERLESCNCFIFDLENFLQISKINNVGQDDCKKCLTLAITLGIGIGKKNAVYGFIEDKTSSPPLMPLFEEGKKVNEIETFFLRAERDLGKIKSEEEMIRKKEQMANAYKLIQELFGTLGPQLSR